MPVAIGIGIDTPNTTNKFESMGFTASIQDLNENAEELIASCRSVFLSLINLKDDISVMSVNLQQPDELTKLLNLLSELTDNDKTLKGCKELALSLDICIASQIFEIRSLVDAYPQIFKTFEYTPDILLEFLEKFVNIINAHKNETELKLITHLAKLVAEDTGKYSNLLHIRYADASLNLKLEALYNTYLLFSTYALTALSRALCAEFDLIARDKLSLPGLEAARDAEPIKGYLKRLTGIGRQLQARGFTFDIEPFIAVTMQKFEAARSFASNVDAFIAEFHGHVTLKSRIFQSIHKSNYFTPGICYGHSRDTLLSDSPVTSQLVRSKRTYADLNADVFSNTILAHQANQSSPNQSLLDSDAMAISLGATEDLYSTILAILAYFDACRKVRHMDVLRVQLIWKYVDIKDEVSGHAVALTIANSPIQEVILKDTNFGICAIKGSHLLLTFLQSLLGEVYKCNRLISCEAYIIQDKPLKAPFFYEICKDRKSINQLCTLAASEYFDNADETGLKEGIAIYNKIKTKDAKIHAIYIYILTRMISIFASTEPKKSYMYLVQLRSHLREHSQHMSYEHATTLYFYSIYVCIFALCKKEFATAALIIKFLQKIKSGNAADPGIQVLHDLATFCDGLSARLNEYVANPHSMDSDTTLSTFIEESSKYSELLVFIKCDSTELISEAPQIVQELMKILVPFQWLPRFVKQFFAAIEQFDPSNITPDFQAKINHLLNIMLEKTQHTELFIPTWSLNEWIDINRKFPNDEKPTAPRLTA